MTRAKTESAHDHDHDVEAIVNAVDETALLDALDEETVRDYLEDTNGIPTTDN